MALDKGLQKFVSEIPECVAAGYVDMESGMLLGVKTVESHPTEVLELVAAATVDIFQGQNVTMIEKLFKKSRGVKDDGSHYISEIIMLSDNLLHVMMRGKKHQDHAVVAVCAKSANMGMVLSKARIGLAALEASL